MVRHLVVGAILMTTILAGCGGLPAAPAPPETRRPAVPGQPPAVPAPATAEQEADGVRVSVRVSQARLQPGDSADVTIWAENRGTKPAIVQGCGPGVFLMIQGPGGARLPAEPKEPRGYCGAIMDTELPPGGRLAEEFTLQVPAFPAAEPVPGGPYVIKASFARGPVKSPPPRLEAEVTVQVGSGEPTLSQAEAVQRAKADPRVQEWLRTHSASGLVRQDPDGQWWINYGDYLGSDLPGRVRDDTGTWGRAAPDMLRALEHEPWQGSTFRAGRWEIQWATKYGLPPHQITAAVDARSGAVVAVTTAER